MAGEAAQKARLAAGVLADVHFQDPNAARILAETLWEAWQAGRLGQQVPVFLFVGANSSTGDALGPFVGWFLKRSGFTGPFFGDLQNPVHATNLKERLTEVRAEVMRLGKKPFIIAVDAAVGRCGHITVNQGPLRPGAGMGKSLPQVGNLHIMGGTATFPFGIWFAALDQTVEMAEVIASSIEQFWDRYLRECGPVQERTGVSSEEIPPECRRRAGFWQS
ncbi:MAG: spore protease YyaC [Bacillota bacterium]